MAIARKPQGNHTATTDEQKEKAADAFITGAGEKRQPEKKGKKIPIMMRFDSSILQKVDQAAEHRGLSRSAWIQFIVSRALDSGEG